MVRTMCNDKSWKSCSIVTIVFTSLLMLGMFIAVGVMNSMFGDNMQCYVDAAKAHENHHNRRQMFEGMDKIAAQHPGIAKTLGSAVKQLPAFRSFAPEGRKLHNHDIPNDDTCSFASVIDDGECDDGPYGLCDCGTDMSDCGRRYSHYDCQEGYSGSVTTTSTHDDKTDEEKVEETENVRCRYALAPPPRTPHQFLPSLCSGRAQRVQPVCHHPCHLHFNLHVRWQRAGPQRREPPALPAAYPQVERSLREPPPLPPSLRSCSR